VQTLRGANKSTSGHQTCEFVDGVESLIHQLLTCYDLKEDLRAWFNQSVARQVAEAGLTDWLAKVQASDLKALQAFTQMIANWREPILNYFEGRIVTVLRKG